MSTQYKPKKRAHIKRPHLWPSIVFLVIGFQLATVIMAVIGTIIIAYFSATRMRASYNEAERAFTLFENVDEPSKQEFLLNTLSQSGNLIEAAYIIDKDGNPVMGYGDLTYNPEFRGYYYSERDVSIYRDLNSATILFDEDMDINSRDVLEKFLSSGDVFFSVNVKDLLKFDDETLILEDHYWFGSDITANETLLLKSRMYFYRNDFLLAVVTGLIAAVLMSFPIFFLFINLLINVHNQKKTTNIIYTDQATDGRNFTYFEENAEKLLYKTRKSGKLYAVVNITMMKYRSYCICHGISAGEELLGRIDRQLNKMISKREYCAHYEKADFALLLECKDKDTCQSRIDEIIKKLPDALGHGGNLIFHAGIYYVETGKAEDGIGRLKRNQIYIAEYYNRASSARASIADVNQAASSTFDQMLLEKQLWEHKVEEKMNRALENEEFKVYLQPKYNPVTEKLSGAEALVRWINDEDGFISPGKFIPIFEENGFIVKLDDYMISHVAALQAKWLKEGKNVVPVSVNVSRAHFTTPNLAEHIAELVDAYKVPHHFIEIELTESAFFDDKKTLLDTVGKLHELGFEVSMDDFGAGYSSLNSLKDLPLDVLKLDAEFFRGEGGEERGEIVVAQAINLAKQLNMRIVAEGVEKKDQVDFLAAQDCDMIQGFYFAKPMPADEYSERL